MDELRAAWAIALKDLRVIFRYKLWVPSLMFQPLYQGIIPAFLFGSAFAVGGRQVGLASSLGTEDLSGFLFMGGVVSSIVAIGIAFFGLRLNAEALRALPAMIVMLGAMTGVGFLVAAMARSGRAPSSTPGSST